MKTLSLLTSLALCLALATVALANPADELRELDRQYKAGQISKKEYDSRWQDVISTGLSPTVPKLPRQAKRAKPARLLNEFSFSGSWASVDTDSESDSMFGGNVLIGRFVTPNLQLSAGAEYESADFGGVDFSSFGGIALVDYHVNPTADFVPYFGGGAAWVSIERDSRQSEDWYWTAHVGIKQYLKPDTAIKYEVGYLDYDAKDVQGFRASIGICFAF